MVNIPPKMGRDCLFLLSIENGPSLKGGRDWSILKMGRVRKWAEIEIGPRCLEIVKTTIKWTINITVTIADQISFSIDHPNCIKLLQQNRQNAFTNIENPSWCINTFLLWIIQENLKSKETQCCYGTYFFMRSLRKMRRFLSLLTIIRNARGILYVVL